MHLHLLLWYEIDVNAVIVFTEQDENIWYVEIDLCISVDTVY